VSLVLTVVVLTGAANGLPAATSLDIAPLGHLVAFNYDAAAVATTTSADDRAGAHRVYDQRAQRLRPATAAIAARLAAEGGESLLSRIGQRLASQRGSIGRPTPLTNSQATDLARWNGFEATGERLRGQIIFRKGNRYIVQDIDSHMGGTLKMADSAAGLRSKGTRLATSDEQLNRLGP
jgi:hypothetical protein